MKKSESSFDVYKKCEKVGKFKHIKEKLSQLPISIKPKDFTHDDLLMAFDATSLYLSAMYDQSSAFPKIEKRYASQVICTKNW